MPQKDILYIVAGDEMQKLFAEKFPGQETVPFREDFSRGRREGFAFDEKFIAERAAFWGVSKEEYAEKMSGIIGLDLSRDLTLVFGDDDCCRANLAFLLGYLKERGYRGRIRVRIVDEYDLTVLREYTADQ